MSLAGKIGTAFAASSTARTPTAGRATFAPGEAMPIDELMAAGGTGPQEESVRDDEDFRGGGGNGGWHGREQARPRVTSRFASMLTTYEVDRYLFNYHMMAQSLPLVVNFGTVAKTYETVFHVIRFDIPPHGSHYNRLH